MAKRIKVHPIGYIPIKEKVRKTSHYGESVKYVQTIHMANGQIRSIIHYGQLALGGGRI